MSPAETSANQSIGFGAPASFAQKPAPSQIPQPSNSVEEVKSILSSLRSAQAGASPGFGAMGPSGRKPMATPIQSATPIQPATPIQSISPCTQSARDSNSNPNSFLGSLTSQAQYEAQDICLNFRNDRV